MVTVGDLAKILNGTVVGDDKVQIKGMVAPTYASPGDITFALSPEQLKQAVESSATCILLSDVVLECDKTVIQVDDMKLGMTVLYNALLEMRPPIEGKIHPTAVIASTAELGKNVSVGANAVIGEKTRIGENVVIGSNCSIGEDITIGENCQIFPNVTIYDHTNIGKRVSIHGGVVIGADGFGYLPHEGKLYKVPQMSNTVIGDDVEIGANSCIDRGTFGATVIGRGVKIDNLVQIAHNVTIGDRVLIAAGTGIGGSTDIGENTMIGGLVGISDHLKIGKNARLGARSGVTGHVKDGATVFGYPYRDATDAKKLFGLQSILLKHSHKLRKFLRELPEK